MDIKAYTYRNRNDFMAIYVCTKCGHEFESWGYSDSNYYNNVLPNAICPKCGLNSFGETQEQLQERLGHIYII